MRFEQFENDALISYGKKHGYITEGMSEEEINEFLPAVAGAARLAGQGLAKGTKAVGQAVQKGTKAVGQVVDKAKAAGQQIAKSVADTGGDPAQEVPPGADMEPSPTGQQHKVGAGAKDVGTKHDGHGHKTDPKDQSKIAQRATALKQVVGNKGSGGQVAAGLDKVSAGNTMSPQLIKAIAPYTQKLQVIMNDPQLSTKFRQLMKQADTAQSQQQTHA